MTLTHPARVRFAPSPTGRLHLGGARTALFNYLIARQSGGQFILRIEDTDRSRYQPDSEQEIIDALHWLGVQWDEGPDVGGAYGPYRQSERKEIYQQYAWELVEKGHAYPCFCTSERLQMVRDQQQARKQATRYDGLCRNIPLAEAKARIAAGEAHVIRFKMPHSGSVTCHDLLRGEITYQNDQLDDYVLVKSDGLALYHLAAMVDDHLMEITHVLRGSEWLPTFPLHTHIYQAFGWQQPVWIHLSVFLKPSGKGKMSKREAADLMEDGYSIFAKDLITLGYVPEAVNNWVALMGWSYDDHTEFFTMQDLIEKFDIGRLNPSPAAINFSKLDHFNGLHIRSLPLDDLAHRLRPFFERAGYQLSDEVLHKLTPLLQPRIKTLDEAPQLVEFLLVEQVQPDLQRLVPKGMTLPETLAAARHLHQRLAGLPDVSAAQTETPVRALADELGIKAGALFNILRESLTGQPVSPPIFETMEIIGREITLARLQTAIDMLAGAV
ncbi:MAG: glutamate--tRNA ligase [Anaerolineales bacterium]